MKVSLRNALNTGLRVHRSNNKPEFEFYLNRSECGCFSSTYGISQLFDYYHDLYCRERETTQFVYGYNGQVLQSRDQREWNDYKVRYNALVEKFLAWREAVQRR